MTSALLILLSRSLLAEMQKFVRSRYRLDSERAIGPSSNLFSLLRHGNGLSEFRLAKIFFRNKVKKKLP